MFLELWKRYSAEITHRWDLTEFDKQEEYPRPEYLARLKHVTKQTVNLITNDLEPKVPFWTMRVPMTVFSFSIIIFLVSIDIIVGEFDYEWWIYERGRTTFQNGKKLKKII